MSEARVTGMRCLRFAPWFLAAAALLSACGFHLQGALQVPASMERTYVRAQDDHSAFYRELRRRLRAAGVQVVDDEASATAIFSILVDETGQRVLSVSARNVPTEYEVYYTVQYGITSGNETVVPEQDLTLTRDYTYDATQVLGKEREQETLRQRIVSDLVRIVMEQVSIH